MIFMVSLLSVLVGKTVLLVEKKMIKFPWKIVMNLSSIRPFFSFLHVNTLLANGRRQKSGGFWVVSTTKSKSQMKILK